MYLPIHERLLDGRNQSWTWLSRAVYQSVQQCQRVAMNTPHQQHCAYQEKTPAKPVMLSRPDLTYPDRDCSSGPSSFSCRAPSCSRLSGLYTETLKLGAHFGLPRASASCTTPANVLYREREKKTLTTLGSLEARVSTYFLSNQALISLGNVCLASEALDIW